MTYSLSNNCTKNYYNRTLTVQVIVEDVVTWIFLRHSVHHIHDTSEITCQHFGHRRTTKLAVVTPVADLRVSGGQTRPQS